MEVDELMRNIDSILRHIDSDVGLSASILAESMFGHGYQYNSSTRELYKFIKYLQMYREGLDYFKVTKEPAGTFYDTCQEGNMIYWKRAAGKTKMTYNPNSNILNKIVSDMDIAGEVAKESCVDLKDEIEGEHRLDAGKRFGKLEPETHLIFELATYFKLWTQEGGQSLFINDKIITEIVNAGVLTPPPSSGKPEIPIVTQFVNSTFDKAFQTKQIKERYSKIPKNVRLRAWEFGNPANINDLLKEVEISPIS